MSSTDTASIDGVPPRPPKVPAGMTSMLRIGLAIGVMILLGALVLTVREWRFIATSTHAIATVSRIDREWMSGSSSYRSGNHGGNRGYRVVASFPVDGRTVEARSHSLTSFTGYKVGDTIAVEYPPGQPERAQLVRFVDRWMLELVLAGIGGVFVAICGFAMWLTTVPGARITTGGGALGIRSPVYSVEADLHRPRSDNGPGQDKPRTRGTLLIAIVLVAGVGIGLLISRLAGRTDGSAAPSRPIVASAGVPSALNDDVADVPPRAGYPSNLTVKAPPMPDDDDKRAVPPTWTDPANGGATAENLTMAARAFLARPQMDATMQAVLRGQVARLGLNCPGVTFRAGDTILFAAPPPMFDGSGALQRGLIRQRFNAMGCPGRSSEFNVWVFAAGNGVPIRTFASYPGTTRADLSLMNDATPVVMAMASRLAPDCRTLAIADTHLTGPAHDATSPWAEDWLVTGCGKTIALTVRFIPDSTRGMTRIEVPDTLARLLPTQ